MKKIFLLPLTTLLLFCAFPSMAFGTPSSMREKFTHAKDGDFIVTTQEGNYSLLFIRSITSNTLLLEEISVPLKLIDLKKVDWKQWVAEKAPGHTSWTLYEIDRPSGKLIECFSFSKNGWLYLDQSEQFLTRLLTLPLSPVLPTERKKIGPEPGVGESDRRAPWNPPLFVEGKKMPKPAFDVVKTQWPDDGSRLSLCGIELYFAKDQPDFPFPYWLEVHSPHYAFKMRAIDSGHHLVSAMPGPMPHRCPEILGMTQKGQEVWKLFIRTPSYFQKIHLFAIDLSADDKAPIPVSHSSKKGAKSEEMILEISLSELAHTLTKGHRYQWVLIPEGSTDIYVESEEVFSYEQTFPNPQ